MIDTPEWHASQWFNTDKPLSIRDFRGRVLAVEAFQMLCPGCVGHGLPQAARIAATFDPAQVAVIGLHTVFEHHAAMPPVALEAFLHEYRIRFPVAVDAPGPGPVPRTMGDWGLQGTPTLLLFDAAGQMRARHFGQVSDLALGAQIMRLVLETDGSDTRA
ncbi:TlpA family protein disulfide reductase [Roseovarius autotrophicus]|uniref:TlpA family protein disulfide reductase n=1 Tax=Roseovarius autotrophicus TaxID=2824121 RepID=UPI0019DCF9F5|nr:TlpA family protein disulfide reductase [Roseovarius autotrophicus]MBE0455466.1 TlpA family protein disulfide reductase [Roseovarius sp.]